MGRLAALLKNPFARIRPDSADVARVKAACRAIHDGVPDTLFVVNEIACTDPGCPGIETVLLVMEPGMRTRAFKIPKALCDVEDADIRTAFAAPDA